MVMFWRSFLVAIHASCKGFVTIWWSVGCAYPTPFHYDISGFCCEPKMVSLPFGSCIC